MQLRGKVHAGSSRCNRPHRKGPILNDPFRENSDRRAEKASHFDSTCDVFVSTNYEVLMDRINPAVFAL
jgi:hypothetical protein